MSSQEFQQKLDDVAPLLQTASEKGKLLTMMEPYGARAKNEVQSKLDELNGKWDELQTKVSKKVAESEEKCEAVTALNNEVETVSRRLDELAASTEDLTAATYDTANVLEHRENYEVRYNLFLFSFRLSYLFTALTRLFSTQSRKNIILILKPLHRFKRKKGKCLSY